ncbi:MAG: FAD-binding oxidoreductase [Patescibacteria group bacterium]|nr:FAD-binding oxidoreductase [Patescibacteria group bacterium]
MPKPQRYTAILEEKQIYNEKYVHFHFELKEPHRIEFQAGQFVSLTVDEENTQRAYSILSDPDIMHGIEILLDVSPNGKGVNYFLNLDFGDEISFLGPMGRFVIKEDAGEQALALVGTGSGIAPLYGMLVDQLKNKNDERSITLYWGQRYEKEMIWEDDLSRLSENYPNFEFHPVLSRPGGKWPLCSGHVTDCLQVHDLLPNTGFYMCGSRNMINDAKSVLAKRGVEKKMIHNEKFY